jgi:hypothetical protein
MDAKPVDKILNRVRALLEKADSTEFPAERDQLLEKAEELMLKYAIDEALLESTRPADKRQTPKMLDITVCVKGHPLQDQIINLATTFADHYRCRIVYFGAMPKSIWKHVTAKVVGYPSDLKFFELSFTNAQLHLAGHIDPKANPSKSFDENVYDLHAAGVSWRNIVYAMNRAIETNQKISDPSWKVLPVSHEQEVRNSGGKCKTAYRRWCKKIGEETERIQSPVSYQRNFAIGYVGEIYGRLAKIRSANYQGGSALALRQESVDELYEETFTDLKQIKHKQVRWDANARSAGRKAGSELDLGGTRLGDSRKALD